MFTGTSKKGEMDWQLIASYFTVKSTDIFCSVDTNTEFGSMHEYLGWGGGAGAEEQLHYVRCL